MHDKPMEIKSVGLIESVTIFVIVSLIGISILLIRRFVFKGELGGQLIHRWISCIIFVILWILYVAVSSLALTGKIGFNLPGAAEVAK